MPSPGFPSVTSLALATVLASACKDAEHAPTAAPDAPTADPGPPAATPPTGPTPTLDELRRIYDEAEGDPTRLERVKEQLLRYLAEHPDDPTALTLLAQVHLEQSRPDESLATAERCIAVAPETAACWLTIGVILETKESKESKDRALEAYRRYLELAPDGRYAPDVRQALDRLGAPGSGTPTSAPLTTRGDIDTTALKAMLSARMSSLKACYEDALRTNPELSGKITYTVSIVPPGRVDAVTIDVDTVGNPGVAACTKAKILAWSLPKTKDRGEVTFTAAFTQP